MKTPRIELVYFEGCPNASQARDNLREAVEASGQGVTFTSSPFTKTVGDPKRLEDPEALAGVSCKETPRSARAGQEVTGSRRSKSKYPSGPIGDARRAVPTGSSAAGQAVSSPL